MSPQRRPLVPLASHNTPPERPLEQIVAEVYARYPRLTPLAIEVVDSRGLRPDVRGSLEYYPPGERMNPKPGKRTIELFNPALRGDALRSALAGDMLHGLPEIDEDFAGLRQRFKSSLTPEQSKFDRSVYAQNREDHDTFDSWMERSWLDAYIRGYLFPDQNDEWRKSGVYTPGQQTLLEEMRQHIQKPLSLKEHGQLFPLK